MAHELRVGLIGLDTSHAPAFAKRFNDINDPEHITGARVTCAYPGGSKDFELSWSRVPGFTKQLADDYKVEMLDSPEVVAENVDLVFIMACDGRAHPDLLKRTIKYKKPTFIDKPFAVSSAGAEEMFKTAKDAGVALMSCSSLRYSDNLVASLGHDGEVSSCDIFGPMAEQPVLPGFFWYGIHMVEILNRVMGRGCKEVCVTKNENADLVAAKYADGRVATIHGTRGKTHHKFGVTLHREKDFEFLDLAANKRAWYTSMLEAIMRTLPQNKSDVASEDTLEIVRIIEACNKSRESGKLVSV